MSKVPRTDDKTPNDKNIESHYYGHPGGYSIPFKICSYALSTMLWRGFIVHNKTAEVKCEKCQQRLLKMLVNRL